MKNRTTASYPVDASAIIRSEYAGDAIDTPRFIPLLEITQGIRMEIAVTQKSIVS